MNRIDFKQVRDLGATLQDASAFIRQNFFDIVKPALAVAIIPLVVGSYLLIPNLQTIYGGAGNMADPMDMYGAMAGMIPAYLLLIVAYILAYVMYIAYMKLYAAGQEDITLSDLMPILKAKGLPLIFAAILLVVIFYLGLVLCVIPGIYLGVVFTHFFAISIIEEKGFGASWSRSFYLIKDNWWSSFGLYLVTYLIAIAIMIVLYIPMYAMIVMDMFSAFEQNDPAAVMNSMSETIPYIMPFYYLISLVISLLYAVVSTFRYFSLVEKKDGTSERELIDQI